MRLLFIIAAGLAATPSAAAESPPNLVLHPLAVARGVPASSDVGAVLELEAARQPVNLIGATEASETLGARRCTGAELKTCLAGLAHATRANFALYVELTEVGANWGFKALVVRDDGTVVREAAARVPAIRKEPVRGARFAVLALFDQLLLGSLNEPPQKPQVAEAPKPAPPPASAPEPVAGEARSLPPEVASQPEPDAELAPAGGTGAVRIAGVVVGAAGLAALGTGGVLGLVAAEDAKGITPVDGAIPHSQLQARLNSDSEATAAAVLAIAGGVAAAVGLVMIIVGGPADGAEVSLAPLPGGAVAGFKVPLP